MVSARPRAAHPTRTPEAIHHIPASGIIVRMPTKVAGWLLERFVPDSGTSVSQIAIPSHPQPRATQSGHLGTGCCVCSTHLATCHTSTIGSVVGAAIGRNLARSPSPCSGAVTVAASLAQAGFHECRIQPPSRGVACSVSLPPDSLPSPGARVVAAVMLSVSKRPGAAALGFLNQRPFSTSLAPKTAPRRTRDLSNSFSNTYDPDEEGRGPMFNKNSFGVPQFYPRDLKKRVDEYVVGQDRAKKTISSVIFNHYQGVRRRNYHDEQERKRQEKLLRRSESRDRNMREKEPFLQHPLEGALHNQYPGFAADAFPQDDFPGHHELVQHTQYQETRQVRGSDADLFYIPEDTSQPQPVEINKSNLLLIGPTGVGKTYILEYATPSPLLSSSRCLPGEKPC